MYTHHTIMTNKQDEFLEKLKNADTITMCNCLLESYYIEFDINHQNNKNEHIEQYNHQYTFEKRGEKEGVLNMYCYGECIDGAVNAANIISESRLVDTLNLYWIASGVRSAIEIVKIFCMNNNLHKLCLKNESYCDKIPFIKLINSLCGICTLHELDVGVLNFYEYNDKINDKYDYGDIINMLKNDVLHELNVHFTSHTYVNFYTTDNFIKSLGVNTSLRKLSITGNISEYGEKIYDTFSEEPNDAIKLSKSLRNENRIYRLLGTRIKFIDNPKPKLLHTLCLIGNSLNDKETKEISKLLCCDILNLRKLDLSINNIGNDGAAHIAKMLKTCTSLQKLILCQNKINFLGAKKIFISLNYNRSLHYLNLDSNFIGDKGNILNSGIIMTNSSLKKLYLRYNKINYFTSTATQIYNFYIYSLNQLDLSYNSFNDDGVTDIVNILSANYPLSRLFLSNSDITDIGCIKIANALITNSNLQCLDLSKNNITERGAIEIAKSLCKNITLQILDLDGNSISMHRTINIVEYLCSNTTLRVLCLGCNISVDVLYNHSRLCEHNEFIKILNQLSLNYGLIDLCFNVYIVYTMKHPKITSKIECKHDKYPEIKKFLERNRQIINDINERNNIMVSYNTKNAKNI